MIDCASFKKCLESGADHICNTEQGKFVITNFPTQGEKCKAYKEKPTTIIQKKVWLPKLTKNQKPPTNLQSTEKTVSFKNGLGWIVAAVLAGVLIGMQLFGA